MDERFDRMDERFDRLEKMVGSLVSEVKEGFRVTSEKADVQSRQIAGLSRRIDSLTRHQRRFAADFTTRLRKAEAKAQITIEGHEAIRSEMRREFATLRSDLDLRVQPIELAVKKGRSVPRR